MSKKLTHLVIENGAKEKNKSKKHFITIKGEEYEFEYNPVFSTSKVAKLVDDYLNMLTPSTPEEMEVDYVVTVDIIRTMLIIKHFTNIYSPTNVSELFNFYLELVDVGIIGEIMGLFNEEETLKVDNALSKILQEQADKLNELNEVFEEIAKEYTEKAKNENKIENNSKG